MSECPVPDLSRLETLSAKIRPDTNQDSAKNENKTAIRRHSAPINMSASQRIKLERIFSRVDETDEEDVIYESDENEFAQSVSRIQITEGNENDAPKIKDASNVRPQNRGVTQRGA